MRSHRCLSLALAAFACLPASFYAQSSTVTTVVAPKGKKSKSAKTQAPPTQQNPAAQVTPVADASATPSVADSERPARVIGEAAAEATPKAAEPAEPAAHTVKVLPAGMEANPPNKDDLAAAGDTWRGEYEADADGKPLLGPDGRPLPVLYNKKGKRVKSRIKVAKSHPISIASGTMTVDGWTGKARLNYDIPDLKFIYLSAPSVGTVIVSQSAFPGSVEQKDAFNGSTLTVKAGDHEMQLSSEKPLLGKKPESAWVKFDPGYTEDRKYPVMGYGGAGAAPYEWPGAKRATSGGATVAPPLPVSMQPKLANAVCVGNCQKPAVVPAAVVPAAVVPAASTQTVTTTVAPHPSK